MGPQTWKLGQQYLCNLNIWKIWSNLWNKKGPEPIQKNGWKSGWAEKPDYEADGVLRLLPTDYNPIYDESGRFYIAELEQFVSS